MRHKTIVNFSGLERRLITSGTRFEERPHSPLSDSLPTHTFRIRSFIPLKKNYHTNVTKVNLNPSHILHDITIKLQTSLGTIERGVFLKFVK